MSPDDISVRTPAEEPVEDYTSKVARLIRTLADADFALTELSAGEIDAVINPKTAAPILLGRAQKELTRSEARFRDLITRAPSIVCEMHPDGTVILMNAAVKSILGWDPRAIEGQNFWKLLIDARNMSTAYEMQRVLRRRDVTAYELPMKHVKDEQRWVAWNSANRYGAGGALESIVLFGVDVTARRETEETNRRLGVAELARSKAEAANKAKMEFLAVMSHELRTPLNAIGGYAQLLEIGIRGPVTREQVEDLQRIRRSQAHLLGLINDIMNFVRLETGRVTYQNGMHKVRSLLDTIDALTAPQVAANGLTYSALHCDDSLEVWGDRDKIQQILINLVSNAIKFTPAGGSIELECRRDAAWVVIDVTDTGKGIPAAKLAEIFDPFVQVNPKYTRPQDGVGLGLAISRDLARGMGGDITAESVEGKGSTFTLRLASRALELEPPES